MGTFIDITGRKFGKLTAVSFSHYQRKKNNSYWNCICECGNSSVVLKGSLLRGKANSCGCGQFSGCTTHGKSRTPEYKAWQAMRNRCYRKEQPEYVNYGNRGITVCDRWRNSFENFYADMGDRPSKDYSVDRIDNDGNYEPSNCRWATRKQQCRNKRDNRRLTHNGVTMLIVEWSELLNLDFHVIKHAANANKFNDLVIKHTK